MNREMSTVQDTDVAVWVCPHGYSVDVLEFAVGGPEPKAEGCPTHGETYIKRCPKSDCPSPIYHLSDLDANYHRPCRTKIPWAEMRSAAARALMEHDPFDSKLLGTKKTDHAFGDFVRKRYFPSEKLAEPLTSRELTAEERQDLIVPPSGRLAAESVRMSEPRKVEPPRITPTRGTGGHLSESDVVAKPRDMSKFIDWEAMKLMREIEEAKGGQAERETPRAGSPESIGLDPALDWRRSILLRQFAEHGRHGPRSRDHCSHRDGVRRQARCPIARFRVNEELPPSCGSEALRGRTRSLDWRERETGQPPSSSIFASISVCSAKISVE
jgi:hypothetical protein